MNESRRYADMNVCPDCNGEGEQLIRPPIGRPYYLICESCFGSGERPVCANCGGYKQLVRPGRFECPVCEGESKP